MNYLILIVGIMFEAFGTTMLKMISGIKDYKHILACMIGYGLGMSGYMYSLKNIGLSVTSAFWNGLGITCTTLIAFLFSTNHSTYRKLSVLPWSYGAA